MGSPPATATSSEPASTVPEQVKYLKIYYMPWKCVGLGLEKDFDRAVREHKIQRSCSTLLLFKASGMVGAGKVFDYINARAMRLQSFVPDFYATINKKAAFPLSITKGLLSELWNLTKTKEPEVLHWDDEWLSLKTAMPKYIYGRVKPEARGCATESMMAVLK